MVSFISTRGDGPVRFGEALLRGLAPDGGLYVPSALGDLPSSGPGRGSFTDSARWAAAHLMKDVADPAVLDRVVTAALDFPAPLVQVEPGVWVLELFHGPTLAFKDVGARFMARAMVELDEEPCPRTVLVATSGDTGGAVAAAFHGLDPYRVVVLFPRDGISARQRRQMTTLGGNVTAVSVEGTFDDCQRIAKAAFADEELRHACRLTSANSVNVGRLLPQSFYYVHAAAELGWRDRAARFVVPSGNLGNLCAGLLATRSGMPARGFVAATNRNRSFVDYLRDGVFEPAPFVHTVSNAMDVADPSNLERLRWLYGDDIEAMRRDVMGTSCDDDETRRCLSEVYGRTGYLMDPHTAVGWNAMEKVRGEDEGDWVILATAHPAKFPEVVEEATGVTPPVPEHLASRLSATEHYVPLAARSDALRELLMEGALV